MNPPSTMFGRWRRHRASSIAPAALTDVIEDVLPGLDTGRARVSLIDPLGSDPTISVDDDERFTRVTVSELARDMERACVPADPTSLRHAFTHWLAARPVSDHDADRYGIAALGWTDPTHTRVAWQVWVPRGQQAAPWTPSPFTSELALAAARGQALARASVFDCIVELSGAVLLWSRPETPVLSTAALADPDAMAATLTDKGLDGPDLSLVIRPGSPLACAVTPAAVRLAEETTVPHVVLPWQHTTDFGWV